MDAHKKFNVARILMGVATLLSVACGTNESSNAPAPDWQPAKNLAIPQADVDRYGIGSYATESTSLPIEFALWQVPTPWQISSPFGEPLHVSVRIKSSATAEVERYTNRRSLGVGQNLSVFSYSSPFGEIISWRRDVSELPTIEVIGRGNFRFFCEHYCHIFVEVQNIEMAALIPSAQQKHVPAIADQLTDLAESWITS